MKDKIRELFDLKNVNFLFGSGTSCGAIPTMSKLLESLKFSDNDNEKTLEKEFARIKNKVGDNLEQCLNVMYAARIYFNGLADYNSGNNDDKTKDTKKKIDLYDKLISKIEKHIFENINISFSEEEKGIIYI